MPLEKPPLAIPRYSQLQTCSASHHPRQRVRPQGLVRAAPRCFTASFPEKGQRQRGNEPFSATSSPSAACRLAT